MFGIVQGGLFNDLRLKSLKELIKIGFDGYAIGGLAVGDSQKEMFKVLDYIKDELPINKPQIFNGCWNTFRYFGCSQCAVLICLIVFYQQGLEELVLAFTWQGRVNIRNAKYQNDNKPLDESVKIFDLNKYSKNYY